MNRPRAPRLTYAPTGPANRATGGDGRLLAMLQVFPGIVRGIIHLNYNLPTQLTLFNERPFNV